jgi:hypothetical protein
LCGASAESVSGKSCVIGRLKHSCCGRVLGVRRELAKTPVHWASLERERSNVGVLTEATMRLREEMGAWRNMRMALRGDLVRQTDERRTRVSALCAGFAGDRASAHRAWFGPKLSKRQTAEMPRQPRRAEEAKAKSEEERRVLADEARANARAKQQPSAKPKAETHRHAPAEPVAAPATRPPGAPLSRANRRPIKGSKKH